jgi:adenine-specific DNA methylase
MNSETKQVSAFGAKGRKHPQRLIEVDLPIKRISAHSRREKSIRHGHISTLHIWWARRPLAACRAVICAALWPDPADPLCPQSFRDAASRAITEFACRACGQGKIGTANLAATCSEESLQRWEVLSKPGQVLDSKDKTHLNVLRFALLDFIADFADWENSTVPEYLETARALTQAAHEALGGEPGTRPLVLDPFAGGGSIPLEALRVGADAFASDLNPVAVLLNKVVLEYIPKYGQKLADEVRKWGQWVKEQAEKELVSLFPEADKRHPPVAYLWARTVRCEGPSCGTEVPLIRSLVLARRGKASRSLELVPHQKTRTIEIRIVTGAGTDKGTVRRGSVTCPICGYTTPVASVRKQLIAAEGGADSSRLLAVVCRSEDGKTYRAPSEADLSAVKRAIRSVKREAVLSPLILPLMSGVFNAPIYGITRWDLLFSSRQLAVADALQNKIKQAGMAITKTHTQNDALATAVQAVLQLAFGKYLDFRTTLCAWISVGEKIGHTFGRQALGMIFDWTEGVPFGDMSGSWERCIDYIVEFIEQACSVDLHVGSAERSPAQQHLLADGMAQAYVTDPPYYNAVPYADLSDFFYPWMRKTLAERLPGLFGNPLSPKDEELCEMSGWDPVRYPQKDASFYERGMRTAFAEGKRITTHSGIGVVVFAHKSTVGWESLLGALIDSNWVITGSWPIDTERGGRLRAMQSAALASSVHLVCRPRSSRDIGDWRDVLAELPRRIHEWMPRLASEGVVGADAIFACLGPALEIFSRYSCVEKASGEQVSLKEYLEHVWAAVAKEALSMIFAGADATGFDPDARLTAMWFWTLSTGSSGNGEAAGEVEDESEMDEEDAGRTAKMSGYVLEYDAARKIAQGLGAHLEQLSRVVEVKGDKATLLAVSERARHLFGKDEGKAPPRRAKKVQQRTLFEEPTEGGEEGSWGELNAPPAGTTVLDRLHQGMILFGAGRSEALKRFLVEEGVGRDNRFWRLAQALSALYPAGSEEKRWVDGVLARKKGLGF